jgi:hypothetical protein
VVDYLAILQEAEERAKQEREQLAAQRKAAKTRALEYDSAWAAVIKSCQACDETRSLPDLGSFVNLASVLKSRGYDIWLSQMAENFAKNLSDEIAFRPGHLFFVQLLMIACEPEVTLECFLKVYKSYVPSHAPEMWRTKSAMQVREFFDHRIQRAEDEQQARNIEGAQKAARARESHLRAEASRRPALEKQLFSVYWSNKGLGPAAIRDKWNEARPKESVSAGTAGREDIKKAVQRGREFLTEHNVSVGLASEILGFKFA